METRQPRFDPESLLSSESQPCSLMQSSRTLDWSDLLLDVQRGYGQSSIFETHSTGDISLVVKLKGCSSVKVLTNGRWQHAFYEVGCGGLTARHQTNRLQFEVQKSDPSRKRLTSISLKWSLTRLQKIIAASVLATSIDI